MPKSRGKHRPDGNQAVIVDGLEDAGAVVQSLVDVGDGCFDLLVGYKSVLWVLEVKQPGESLNAKQVDFLVKWHGYNTGVVRNTEEALKAIGADQ